MILDVTVINAVHVALLQRAAEEPKDAAGQAYSVKKGEYRRRYEFEGLFFIPLCVDCGETSTGMTEIFETKKLGSMLARATREDDSATIRHFLQ